MSYNFKDYKTYCKTYNLKLCSYDNLMKFKEFIRKEWSE